MEPGGTAPDGEVLDGVVIAEAMGDDGGIELVFTKLDFLFVQPDVKTGVGFLEVHHVEIVYQHIRKDGLEKVVCFNAAKLLNMLESFYRQPGLSADPEFLPPTGIIR